LKQDDWSFQTSLQDEKYTGMVLEPVDSIHILVMQAIPSSSSLERTYHVVFEIKAQHLGGSRQ